MYTPSALKIFYQDRLWHSLLTAIHSFMSSPSGIWTASFKLPLPRVCAACCGIGGRRWDGSRKRRGEWVGSSTILLNPADTRLGGPYTGPLRGLWGPGQIEKVGPIINIVWGGSGGTHLEILRFYMFWSVFWGLLEAPFRACIQYIHTCKLPSSFSSFRLKSTMYVALVSGCA